MNAFVQTEKICPNGPKGSVEPQFLHEKQVSSFLNVSLGLLRKWRTNGDGPNWVKFEDSVVRYPVPDLTDFVSKSRRKFTGQTKPPSKRGPL